MIEHHCIKCNGRYPHYMHDQSDCECLETIGWCGYCRAADIAPITVRFFEQ